MYFCLGEIPEQRARAIAAEGERGAARGELVQPPRVFPRGRPDVSLTGRGRRRGLSRNAGPGEPMHYNTLNADLNNNAPRPRTRG